jgi:hypothetical protein
MEQPPSDQLVADLAYVEALYLPGQPLTTGRLVGEIERAKAIGVRAAMAREAERQAVAARELRRRTLRRNRTRRHLVEMEDADARASDRPYIFLNRTKIDADAYVAWVGALLASGCDQLAAGFEGTAERVECVSPAVPPR